MDAAVAADVVVAAAAIDVQSKSELSELESRENTLADSVLSNLRREVQSLRAGWSMR